MRQTDTNDHLKYLTANPFALNDRLKCWVSRGIVVLLSYLTTLFFAQVCGSVIAFGIRYHLVRLFYDV